MLRSYKSLKGYHLGALDGEIGKVRDMYFDDQQWGVRYVIADTGHWLTGRQVLISPASLGMAEYETRAIRVNLSRKQIEDSPPISAHQPVSRQREAELNEYFEWPIYWNPDAASATAGFPFTPVTATPPASEQKEGESPAQPEKDLHLRSANEVIGYDVQATDGPMGHIDDFILDENDWSIQQIVIDTRKWWPSTRLLVLPMWVTSIDWGTTTVQFSLDRATINAGPTYEPSDAATTQTDLELRDYYGRPAKAPRL